MNEWTIPDDDEMNIIGFLEVYNLNILKNIVGPERIPRNARLGNEAYPTWRTTSETLRAVWTIKKKKESLKP